MSPPEGILPVISCLFLWTSGSTAKLQMDVAGDRDAWMSGMKAMPLKLAQMVEHQERKKKKEKRGKTNLEDTFSFNSCLMKFSFLLVGN